MRKRKEPNMIVREKWLKIADNLDDAELGELFRATLNRKYRGEVYTTTNEKLRLLYLSLYADVIDDLEKYEEKCERNREWSNKRWNKSPSVHADGDEDAE